MKFFSVRGLQLAYNEWGEKDRPLILYFHGFLDHGLSFAPIAEFVADSYYSVAIDFRGHGYSGWIGDGGYYHFMDYAADAWRLIEVLGPRDVHLVGHSMGGSVAVAIAALFGDRVKSIVLLEGMGPPSEDLSTAPDRLRRWVDALAEPHAVGDVATRRAARRSMKDLDEAVLRMRRINLRLSEERARALAAYGTEPAPDGGLVWRFDPLHRTPSARPFNIDEYRHHWSAITAPVLSLYGYSNEWWHEDLPARHGQIRDVQVGIVEDAGHNMHHDQPAVIASAVASWISGERRKPVKGILATGHDLKVLEGGTW